MLRLIHNILMVDDDEDDQFLFQEALQQINEVCCCEIVSNGSEAIKKLGIPPPPDIIFLDLNMPIMNGFECLRNLRAQENYKDIPVVVYSTTNDKQSIELLKSLGATAFFQKPTDFSHLQFKLKKLLGDVSNGNALPVDDFVI